MRLALSLSLLGAFRIIGDTDFCAIPKTDFPITWIKPFDVDNAERTLGQAITMSGIFSIAKQLAALAIKDFSVSRADLEGAWSLWTPGGSLLLPLGFRID